MFTIDKCYLRLSGEETEELIRRGDEPFRSKVIKDHDVLEVLTQAADQKAAYGFIQFENESGDELGQLDFEIFSVCYHPANKRK